MSKVCRGVRISLLGVALLGAWSGAIEAARAQSEAPPHVALLKNAKKVDGLIPLYRDGRKLFAELSSGHYSGEYIVLISIARGIGQDPLLGGYSWGDGDDWVWQLRKIDDRVHIVRRNVRFKAKQGTPESTAVGFAYTDSVLFSLPIVTKGPQGGDLIDLSPVFLGDLPQISQQLPGFSFSSDKSTWAEVKGFADNLQLQVAATYASSGQMQIESVPDSRGVTLNVHYSISKVPATGYAPRLADDRVGYFLTVVKDYTQPGDDRFVRYINRWQLEKADPSAKISPPKRQIVFWLEKTIPFTYRPVVREGIEEWNRAFEQAGIANAIEVRQQPDDATWDPEDINYNTFRWITASAGFAMGPSRVNPYTGQILDADIIFDSDFLQFWKREFETLTPAAVAEMTGGPLDPAAALLVRDRDCRLSDGMSRQFAFTATAILSRADAKLIAEQQDRLIRQGLKEVVMHEVGHTLGLRHNFKASRLRSLKELNDPQQAREGLVASVMDYTATNIVPKDWQQGDYFTTTIGPYDLWAIEYGYKPLSGGTQGELEELKKIAGRSGEPALQYATDEDTVASDPDPDANRFDLGSDPLEYARVQAQLAAEIIPTLVERMSKEGEDYSKVRQAFNVLLSQYGQAMFFASRTIGGLRTSRSHKGDKDAQPPVAPIDVAAQRGALELVETQVLSDQPFQFPPELYGYLAASRWRHWGTSSRAQKDFPLHDTILMWQSRILDQLLSPVTLGRIHDSELKTPADQDVLTTAELIERLTGAVFAEVGALQPGEHSNRQPAISSLRRNLQRHLLDELGRLALGSNAPEDCRAVAAAQLSRLAGQVELALQRRGELKLDTYTTAHLEDSLRTIRKVLDAQVEASRP